MSIVLFFLVLFVIVIVHEFGHFIVAKKAGIRVDEFAFGFPPRLGSIKIGETHYSFNALPLGGYVKIYGENPNDVSDDDRARSFGARSRFVQAGVIIAGVVFNILLAWLLIASTLMIGINASLDGEKVGAVTNVKLIVTGVQPSSPADLAGILPGDTIITLKSGDTTVHAESPEVVSGFIGPRGEGELLITLLRDGRTTEHVVTPKLGIVPDRAAIGISMDMVGTLRLPPHTALIEGAKRTYHYTVLTAVGLWDFLFGAIMGKGDFSQVTGPVGIVNAVGEAADVGFVNLVLFAALISINLAVINIIPFPALDGGRLLFIIIETIIRRPLPIGVANITNLIGFSLLMLLMLAVTWNDISKLLN